MTTDQFFKAIYHHRGECYWPVVVQSGDVGFLGRGTMVEDVRQDGTVNWESDWLKILML